MQVPSTISSALQLATRDELILLQKVAFFASKASTPRTALRYTLNHVCTAYDWDVRHAFVLQAHPHRLHPVPSLWRSTDAARFAPFRRSTMAAMYDQGDGLIGTIAGRRKPMWISTVEGLNSTLRPGSDESFGVESGLLVPIWADHLPCAAAVLEFWSRKKRPSQKRQTAVAMGLATLLGRVFEREHVERQLSESREREQQRIGRELHDSVAQDLTAIVMRGERLVDRLGAREPGVVEDIRPLIESTAAVRSRVHALARGLVPLDIVADQLAQSLQYVAQGVKQAHQLECEVRCDDGLRPVDDVTANHLLRIAQEAVQNAVKHARAGTVTISWQRRRSRPTLTVTDDGTGYVQRKGVAGIGQRLMSYRAAEIGAELTVTSRPGQGTRVRCRLPGQGVSRSA